MRVFVTGATGLVGSALCHALAEAGHEVTALSRSGQPKGLPAGVRVVQGDPALPGTWQDALAACDACVNLAGEPVAGGRWTDERKRNIRDSRVHGTQQIARVLARGGPTVLVSGSAVGYYGPRDDDEAVDEAAPAGDDFLAHVCAEWEQAALAAAPRARVVLLRSGIVLSPRGGALEHLALPFRFFAGGPIGRGAFWQPWIHLADEVGLARWALENPEVRGPLNATAPNPVRNRELAEAVGRALGRPSALPVPPVALKVIWGELAGIITSGQRAVPRRALELGYRFRFPEVGPALADLLGR